MSTQQWILVLAIAVLIPVWWLTLPEDAAVTPPPPEIGWGGPSGRAVLMPLAPPEIPWASNFDTSRPECIEMRDELIEAVTNGTATDLIYIGDCDKRVARRDDE